MGKIGCALIGFAVFFLFAFVADQVFFRDRQDAHNIENFESEDYPEEEEEDPRLSDPELYAPSIADDISSERFMLSIEETKLAETGKDYEYVIKEGDTIDELARKYLGSHNLKSILFQTNSELTPGAQLPVGTKIIIPFRERIP